MPDRIYDVVVLGDSPRRLNEALLALGAVTSLKLVDVVAPPKPSAYRSRVELVNVDMRSVPSLTALKTAFTLLPEGRRPRLFALDPTSHAEVTQSHALGATGVVAAPIEPRQLVAAVAESLGKAEPPTAVAGPDEVASHAGSVLRNLLLATRVRARLPVRALETYSATLVESIAAEGIGPWLAAVRRNHAGTFEHCLTVTATAVAFGVEIGARGEDLVKLAAAAMAHDVGKAFLPVEILEKPGRLDPKEAAIVRMHPFLGHEALKQSGAGPLLLDVALNHHEYLDGSGYPNGISGAEISDFTRVLTIADIFSALVERRAYKDPMDPMQAHGILVDMGPKLDVPLVRAFRPVAERLFRQQSGEYARIAV